MSKPVPESITAPHASDLDLNRIAIWVRVVECGSITAAAKTLDLPKSSVSRAVNRLESELRVSLLQRTTRTLTLTPAGERYLASARAALQLLEEAHSELINADGALRGAVRVTAPVDWASRLGKVLARALAAFTQQHPEVYIDLIMTGRRVDLIGEGVDIAVRAGKLEQSQLIARKFASDSTVLVAAPAYLKEHGTPRRVPELAAHRSVLYRASQGALRISLSGPNGSEAVTLHGPISVDDVGFMLSLAEQGVGIALVPALMAEESLRTGRLVRVLPQHARREGALYLVYPAQRHPPRRTVVLREFLYRTLKEEFADLS